MVNITRISIGLHTASSEIKGENYNYPQTTPRKNISNTTTTTSASHNLKFDSLDFQLSLSKKLGGLLLTHLEHGGLNPALADSRFPFTFDVVEPPHNISVIEGWPPERDR